MDKQDSLVFSNEALFNRSYFYDGLNDINLFVEDADSQFFYERIFKRLLGEKYKIQSIFPCGGKPEVKKAFHEKGKETNGIKNIYIVDGDFDRILFPDEMIDDNQFVYLRMYNIESYLVNEKGLCSLVQSKLRCIESEALAKLRYQEWYSRIIFEAKELFLCYCFIQKFNLGIPNVNRSHYEFLDSKTGFQRTDGSFQRYKSDLISAYPNAEEEITLIRNMFEAKCGNHYEILICGKYLLSSLHDYLYFITKKRIDKDDLLWCLVNSFDVSTLDYVKEICLNE